MKKVAIMQPYIFPYLGYFQAMKAVDDYVIYDDVNYIKGGWINRNNILIGGNKVLFTIALDGASPNKLINQIVIKHDFNRFLKTVSMAYSRAPYFLEVYQIIEKICNYDDKQLDRFAGNSFVQILDYLDIKTNLIYSSTLNKNIDLKGQEKVIDICKELKANMYINAIGGRTLYSSEDFAQHNIELKFIKTNILQYKQFKNDFIPGLSIIDILMFNSKPEILGMLDNYELL